MKLRSPSFFYFDMGNVLLRFSHRRGAEQMARVAGAPVERVFSILYGSSGENGLHWDFESGLLTPDEFYARFNELTGCNAAADDLAEACNDIFELNDGMLPLIAALQATGRPLGVLSNTTCDHWKFVNRRFPTMMRRFSVLALSCNLKAMKPDPIIYARAAELAEAPPAGIFFTDDRPDNVAAAKSAGWDAVQFTTVEQLRSDLLARGIVV